MNKPAQKIMAGVAEVKPALEAPLMGWARGNLDDLQAQLARLPRLLEILRAVRDGRNS